MNDLFLLKGIRNDEWESCSWFKKKNNNRLYSLVSGNGPVDGGTYFIKEMMAIYWNLLLIPRLQPFLVRDDRCQESWLESEVGHFFFQVVIITTYIPRHSVQAQL